MREQPAVVRAAKKDISTLLSLLEIGLLRFMPKLICLRYIPKPFGHQCAYFKIGIANAFDDQ